MATGVTAPEASSAMDNQFFYEDEVFRIDKQGRVKFGLVLENEAYSTDDETDYEDVLSKGEIRVAWHPDGKENIMYEKMVGLADRTLIPGDIVRRLVPGKDTQRGYCREINMRADLKIVGTKYIIKNVIAERLRPLVKYNRDNAVCFDSWVGSTKCVNEKIILKSSCGAIIEVPDVDLCPLRDKNTKFRNGQFADTVFYPGQTVTGRLDSLDNVKLLTPSIHLKTNKKGKLLERKFVVQSVHIEGVWVHWQCKALSEDGSELKNNVLQQPKPYVSGEDLNKLKYLNLFESCMLQINDKNYLKITDCDVIVKKSQWEKEQAIKYILLLSQQKKDDNQSNVNNKNTKISSKNAGDRIKIMLTHSSLIDGECKKQLITKGSKLSNTSSYGILKSCIASGVGAVGNDNVTVVENINENLDNNISTTDEKTEKKPCTNIKSKTNMDDNKLKPNKEVYSGTDGWLTDEECDDIDNEDIEENSDSTTTTISTCSSPTPKSSPKCSPLLHKKQIKSLKKNIVNTVTEKMPVVGDQVVTEALVVYSTATVVWQDGTVETGIPSTQLYPIHHLDDHEFFPGDFVLSGVESSNATFRDYGVIQKVDHQGRTAHVKWFTTYTSADEPKPAYTGESEVSVYDLKDHPDFQYRPGTIVIRVANFIGEDAACTAGQIIDNYVDGRVKVWWVDGHISMCWPQDLFEVGQYDADNNFWGNNESDNDSWETESEISEPGGSPQKGNSGMAPHLEINLERARVSMSRLEELFNINPNLQNQEVMRKLLAVYKKCRYLDRLMNTTYFHEDNFMGLLERVRKGGSQSKAERAVDQKNRLFNLSPNSKQLFLDSEMPNENETKNIVEHQNDAVGLIKSISPREYSPKVILNLTSTPFKYLQSKKKLNKLDLNSKINIQDGTTTTSNNATTNVVEKNDCTSTNSNNLNINKIDLCSNSCENINDEIASVIVSATKVSNHHHQQQQQQPIIIFETNNKVVNGTDQKNLFSNEKNKLLSSVISHIEKATKETEKSNQFKINTSLLLGASGSTSQDDSGTYCRTNDFCDGSSTSYASSNDLTADVLNTGFLKANDDQKSISCSSIELTDDIPEHVCAHLCTLLKGQLIKALQEIQQKYCKNILNLSDVYSCPDDNDYQNDIDEKNDCDENKENTTNDNSNQSSDREEINATTPLKTEKEDNNVVEKSSLDDSLVVKSEFVESFQIMESAPTSHKFHLTMFHSSNAQQYFKAINREHKLLRSSLPPGVWVRVFEDRMDLVSVMIEGPQNTPYENGMFFFDIQLGRDYPNTPPLCHYVSFCSDRLNPNLYEDGKVCVSLLGTWSGRESEIWGSNSTLLQVIVSIQGLILVAEPYFNEAGYEKQKGTQQGIENSRKYNEMVVIKLVQSMTKLLSSPPQIFREQIIRHFEKCGKSMHARIKGWMELSQLHNSKNDTKIEKAENDSDIIKIEHPDFSLVPASRGFCLTLAGLLDNFNSKIENINLTTEFGDANNE